MNTCTEHDLLGDKEVPAAAYYGIHALRACKNFAISGTLISSCPSLIRALTEILRPEVLTHPSRPISFSSAD
ncbi:MAG: hypothetical protein P4L87_17155 [Formivibrio sp.]|nr:hypothetical protein [Formivibrio sp.]